jgi:hypothetical protein
MTWIIRKSVAALIVVLALLAGAALGYAQARQGAKPAPSVLLNSPDIGFRVEGQKENSVVGRFVVRINGRWLDVDNSFAPKVLTTGH